MIYLTLVFQLLLKILQLIQVIIHQPINHYINIKIDISQTLLDQHQYKTIL